MSLSWQLPTDPTALTQLCEGLAVSTVRWTLASQTPQVLCTLLQYLLLCTVSGVYNLSRKTLEIFIVRPELHMQERGDVTIQIPAVQTITMGVTYSTLESVVV